MTEATSLSPADLADLGAIEEFASRFQTDAEAAEALGIKPSTLSRAKNPAQATSGRIASVKSRVDLVAGLRGAEAEGAAPALSAQETRGVVPPGYTRVPEILIEPSAAEVWDVGTEEDVEPEETPSDTIFPDWYIRSEYGVSPDRIRFVRVRGDSMVPTVSPGQRLVVALLFDGYTLRDSSVYIIVGPGGAQVKRLMIEPGHVHVWSDNPDRPRFRVNLETFYRDYKVVAIVLETNVKL